MKIAIERCMVVIFGWRVELVGAPVSVGGEVGEGRPASPFYILFSHGSVRASVRWSYELSREKSADGRCLRSDLTNFRFSGRDRREL